MIDCTSIDRALSNVTCNGSEMVANGTFGSYTANGRLYLASLRHLSNAHCGHYSAEIGALLAFASVVNLHR